MQTQIGSDGVKLNLGCGPQIVDGWVNVDYSLGARLSSIPLVGGIVKRSGLFNVTWDSRIFLHDIRSPLPWADASVEVCYSSHTVEHLSHEEGSRLAREAFRVLKPGGIFRVVVPDLACFVQSYLSNELPAEKFVDELGVQYGSGKRGLKRVLAPVIEFPHRCMYDHSSMLRLFSAAGFVAEKRGPFESGIAQIRGIEMASRTQGAVIVEGTKP